MDAFGLAAVLPMGALFVALVGAGLTLSVLFCCAQPLRLMPTSATATTKVNLICFYSLLRIFGCLIFQIRCTHPAIQPWLFNLC